MKKYDINEIDFIRTYINFFESVPSAYAPEYESPEVKAAAPYNHHKTVEDMIRTMMFAEVEIEDLRKKAEANLKKMEAEQEKNMQEAKAEDAKRIKVKITYEGYDKFFTDGKWKKQTDYKEVLIEDYCKLENNFEDSHREKVRRVKVERDGEAHNFQWREQNSRLAQQIKDIKEWLTLPNLNI